MTNYIVQMQSNTTQTACKTSLLFMYLEAKYKIRRFNMQSGTSAIETGRQQENIFEIPILQIQTTIVSTNTNNLFTSFKSQSDINFISVLQK